MLPVRCLPLPSQLMLPSCLKQLRTSARLSALLRQWVRIALKSRSTCRSVNLRISNLFLSPINPWQGPCSRQFIASNLSTSTSLQYFGSNVSCGFPYLMSSKTISLLVLGRYSGTQVMLTARNPLLGRCSSLSRSCTSALVLKACSFSDCSLSRGSSFSDPTSQLAPMNFVVSLPLILNSKIPLSKLLFFSVLPRRTQLVISASALWRAAALRIGS